MGGGLGIWVKLHPRVLFLNFFFGSFNASTAYPEKRGFSLSASENVFRWWVCSFGVDFHSESAHMHKLWQTIVYTIIDTEF